MDFLRDLLNSQTAGDSFFSYASFYIFLLIFVPVTFILIVFIDYFISKVLKK
ncbi:hypothetical protein MYP_32 [Sporocytophaga myxococcoides]|uniref:Uncharacterized protein n=1 Tax=Sporocytophaga myxococcoides TaxID=153721 RepID=A0A098L873_9BACT|nr:hypothetical protein MYP_32 [Sporocytophaga myxococcoides]